MVKNKLDIVIKDCVPETLIRELLFISLTLALLALAKS